ncbi:aldo/keto reductase [Sphingomonas sp. BIUV-7]|uniref:Aldo/keto reductase n=1 Tax=Sphingomonas natans TaxID=3063330 RepID=A0ABT8Y529_9SPHN|nr:aldo/keto reductase [Sphingomonas sp. BIUV-7]MDO6413422.1 aldo/keto reductase [Sphingomonas sp. BIUV-7]
MPERRALGASGLVTAPLMLGGNVFGWTADRRTSFDILDAFVAGGGMLIDTADVYSAWVPGNAGGESETIIGEWLKARGRRDDVLIATKMGMLDGPDGKGLDPKHIAAAAEASLRRLGTDYIDLYFAHKDDESVPQAEALGALDALVGAGKVRAIGASNFTADRLASALAASDADGLARYTVLEPHYNLVERGFEGALQDLCVAENIGVVPYYALASGFLTGKYRDASDAAKSGGRGAGATKYLDDRGRRVLAALDAVAAEQDAAVATIALAWLAARPAVVAPIASASRIDQLPELLYSMAIRLTADQIERLDAASA